MRVKICGIRRLEDARTALQAGAWALGFIFHRPSRRFIEPRDAGLLVRELPRESFTVGVFVDAPIEEVNAAVQEANLQAVQLHGSEDAAYAARVVGAQVIKAFRVGPKFDPRATEAFGRGPILLDSYHPSAAGGTGTTFDWKVARDIARSRDMILAGGLNPENVARAVEEVRPWAIDVSSGVEVEPGVKSPERIASLFEQIRAAERSPRARGG